MRPGKTPRNSLDPILARSTANAQYPLGLRERGNVNITDNFKLLEDLRQLRGSTLFRLQEVHEKLSATTTRVQSVQNGFVAEVKHIEVSIHSETIFVPDAHELFDTLHQAARRLDRAIDEWRF